MTKPSAGLLLHRRRVGLVEVLLIHPGGPYWAHKDAGAWSIPKGTINAEEDPRAAAYREFREETGGVPPDDAVALGPFRQPGGKIIHAFAAAGDFDLAGFHSNSFSMQWPPRSGRMVAFPEADRADWFVLAEAVVRIVPGQRPILDALVVLLDGGGEP